MASGQIWLLSKHSIGKERILYSARDKYILAAPLMTKVSKSVKSMAHNVSDAPTDDSVELHILRS